MRVSCHTSHSTRAARCRFKTFNDNARISRVVPPFNCMCTTFLKFGGPWIVVLWRHLKSTPHTKQSVYHVARATHVLRNARNPLASQSDAGKKVGGQDGQNGHDIGEVVRIFFLKSYLMTRWTGFSSHRSDFVPGRTHEAQEGDRWNEKGGRCQTVRRRIFVMKCVEVKNKMEGLSRMIRLVSSHCTTETGPPGRREGAAGREGPRHSQERGWGVVRMWPAWENGTFGEVFGLCKVARCLGLNIW